MKPADYHTRLEAAAVLGVAVETLDRWRKAGKGPPATVIGRTILYRKETFDRWLAGREVTQQTGEMK
jgi:excisionase family DNA binding protein